MNYSDDDEDLKLAVALSMQQSPSAMPTDHTIVDLTSDNVGDDDDSDGDDLRRAIALSLQENMCSSKSETPSGAVTTGEQSASTTTTTELTQQRGNLVYSAEQKPEAAGWDRKAMELARLARLEKRKRKRSLSTERPSKQRPSAPVPEVVKGSTPSTQSQSDAGMQYPRGAIKRTFATKFPRTDDITLDELVQASTVNIAVISSFQWDAEWLGSKLSHNKVKQIWVMNAKGADTQARWRRELAEHGIPNLVVHFPPMDGVTLSSHSKYMLMFSDTKLRVVVTTANMEREYWGEVRNKWQPGVLENSVFVIDLPRRADGIVGSKEELTPFGYELIYFLEAQKLDRRVVEGVLKFDFSQTRHLAFVHSIGGTFDGSALHPTGLPGLSKAMRDLHLDKVASLELDYAASSLGAVDDGLLQRIYLAAQGLPFTAGSDSTVPAIQQKMRIYYPTKETIQASIGGPDCAGIVSLKKEHYNLPTFPAACLRDYTSTRTGMISHNKLLFARGRHVDGTGFAWVYVGSANLSGSAWGSQKVLKNGKMGKLSIRNWECGVVVPVPREQMEALELEEGGVPAMRVFEGTIEVPFRYPGERYEGRLPHLMGS
ncbi:uncharacterized protein EKO05_0007690 [Ascochyta rabiei]|uniref:uncharacterized protein n=1 Tax=Didymella rabiei TaxID=5454 RepID=UPI0021FD887E|nr:uncharacterized protein EKO05_0007690 [Ascochyta rabiei]UPX17326.1 hypothetical protein EKO05_0007690 [Ascochyta rabiei]